MISSITDDTVTLVLLGLMILLMSLPIAFFISYRVTRPPFPISYFRWLCLAWACLLVASSVWTMNRDPRFSMQQAGADNYVRLAFLVLGVLIMLGIGAGYKFAFLSELRTGPLGLFFLFALWGFATTLWSVFPPGTLVKASEYCSMLLLFAIAASLINKIGRDSYNRLLALKSVFDFVWFLVFILILSVYLGVLIWPDFAIERAWRDESGVVGFSIQGTLPGISDNGVGQLGAIMGSIAFVRLLLIPRFRVFYASIFAVSLLTMVVAQSRSPVLGFSIAVGAILIASRQFRLLALSSVLMGGLMLTQYGQLIYDFMRRGQSVQLLTSLTGRVEYWQASFKAIYDKPLGGYGANVGGRYVLQNAFGLEGVSTVHSTWVEILLDTGVVGLILFTLGFGLTWYWLLRLRSTAMKTPISRLLWLESLGILTVLSVRSIFSVTFVWAWEVLFFGLVLILISVTRRQIAQERYAAGAPSAQPLPATGRGRSSLRS